MKFGDKNYSLRGGQTTVSLLALDELPKHFETDPLDLIKQAKEKKDESLFPDIRGFRAILQIAHAHRPERRSERARLEAMRTAMEQKFLDLGSAASKGAVLPIQIGFREGAADVAIDVMQWVNTNYLDVAAINARRIPILTVAEVEERLKASMLDPATAHEYKTLISQSYGRPTVFAASEHQLLLAQQTAAYILEGHSNTGIGG